MTVSEEIVLSMTAIMTAFAPGENRSMLNLPFPNGKAANRENVAPSPARGAGLSARESALAQRSSPITRAVGRIVAVARPPGARQ
ncbi:MULTISPECIES: hypothetical protein [unclassified Burkholderia]|uniref:hypothetical protein n=1 Tax=unclassified Burkholderia TaxID=2613784 RepID=UPI000F589B0A|nr:MULTISPECIES: hypothetical protein [unclassified Burkholderia]